jgi:pyruvate formate lyase activating enzyme
MTSRCDRISAPVFDIQRFSLHDGPGIRSLVFLKGCALHCPWCQNPESQDHEPIVAFYRDRCVESFECEASCPEDAIERDGFRVAYARCTGCGLCVDACPSGALRRIGEEHTPEQLMEKLRADVPYYESSGGGVTFTGGEPTLHPRFLDRMLDLCRSESIHTNLETSGTFSLTKWAPILAKLDLIYFDLKLLDPEAHARQLGSSYETIEKNALALAKMGLPVEFRMPVVPGFTDTEDNLERAIGLLARMGKRGIHLLAYHNMGEAKIDIIQGSQPRLGLPRYSNEQLEAVRASFRSRGIDILNAH